MSPIIPKDLPVAANLLVDFEKTTKSVKDPALRNQIVRACERIEFPGEVKVMKVAEVRDAMKAVRSEIKTGEVVIVAERGSVESAEEATVMLSVKTLQQTLIDALERALLSQRRRDPADLLIGLPPIGGPSLELDVDGKARKKWRRPGSDLEL
jgi:hypothetical protein